MLDDRPHDDGDIGDAAASGSDGHALARPDLAQVQPGKLRTNFARYVVDAGGVESLAKAEDCWGNWSSNSASYHPEALLFKTKPVERIPRRGYNGENHPGRGAAMGIRFYCPKGHKLNVKQFQAGQTGVCPRCGATVPIPLKSAPAEVPDDMNGISQGNGSARASLPARPAAADRRPCLRRLPGLPIRWPKRKRRVVLPLRRRAGSSAPPRPT